jgi:hypothetical protein
MTSAAYFWWCFVSGGVFSERVGAQREGRLAPTPTTSLMCVNFIFCVTVTSPLPAPAPVCREQNKPIGLKIQQNGPFWFRERLFFFLKSQN